MVCCVILGWENELIQGWRSIDLSHLTTLSRTRISLLPVRRSQGVTDSWLTYSREVH